MEDSILVSIKKLIGLAPEDESFDIDLITHINSAIDVLTQLGMQCAAYDVTAHYFPYSYFKPSILEVIHAQQSLLVSQ